VGESLESEEGKVLIYALSLSRYLSRCEVLRRSEGRAPILQLVLQSPILSMLAYSCFPPQRRGLMMMFRPHCFKHALGQLVVSRRISGLPTSLLRVLAALFVMVMVCGQDRHEGGKYLVLGTQKVLPTVRFGRAY